MHSVISNMMAGVKEQKVNHLKSLKKLSNEKTLMTKKFKELKDENANLKIKLDNHMQVYQSYQKDFDLKEATLSENEKEKMEMKMAELLTIIEKERVQWMFNRDSLKVRILHHSVWLFLTVYFIDFYLI